MSVNDALHPPDRFRIEDKGDELEILIPVKKDRAKIVYLWISLAIWSLGEVRGIRELMDRDGANDNMFLVFWLAFWTVGGILVAANLAWHVAGYERIRFRRDRVIVRREALGLGISHEFDTARASTLRLADDFHKGRDPDRYVGPKECKVAFDHEQTRVRFGFQLDRSEAARLILKIQKRFGFTKT